MEYKICSLDYFLDKMTVYELHTLIPMLNYSAKQEWERARFLGYITAQTQSSKKIKMTDILKFSWDDDDVNDTKVSNEDKERLMKKMKIIEEKNKI